jgi:subtilisin family serine protease
MGKRIKKIKQTNHAKCSLLPFVREEIVSVQEAKQKLGWEISAFNLPETWKHSKGEGVVVAVLDTGCDLDHQDLKENLLPGKNFVNPGLPPEDKACGHGTHVTGIICALDNDKGIVGVAPKTKVIPVKVLDDKGSGDLSNVAAGIRWSADQGADFITMSLGSPTPTPIIQEAVKYAASKGVVTFCAAGNAGKTHQIFYPAAYPEVIGIGAIDENFDRANFSCTGPDLDFLAPGVKILSTVPENWYAIMSGTSMANPYAVGVACLLLSYKRAKNLDLKLETNLDYINVFRQYTTHVKNPEFNGKQFYEGFGIIDPRKMQDIIKS